MRSCSSSAESTPYPIGIGRPLAALSQSTSAGVMPGSSPMRCAGRSRPCSRGSAGRPAIGRDRPDRDMPAVRHRAHDRAHHFAGAAALGEEVEQSIAFGELRHHRIAVGIARVLPLLLGERADRSFERVVEIRILPDRALPDIGEQRSPVELGTLEADIGGDVFRRRIEDRARLEFAQFPRDRVQLLRRSRTWAGGCAILPLLAAPAWCNRTSSRACAPRSRSCPAEAGCDLARFLGGCPSTEQCSATWPVLGGPASAVIGGRVIGHSLA